MNEEEEMLLIMNFVMMVFMYATKCKKNMVTSRNNYYIRNDSALISDIGFKLVFRMSKETFIYCSFYE